MKKAYLFILGSFIFNLSCNAMMEEERQGSPVLKIVKGKTIAELKEMQATVSYNWMPQSLGNTLSVDNGQLNVTCPSIEAEKQVIPLYNSMKKEMTVGLIMGSIDLQAKSQKHSQAECIGRDYLKLSAETEFVGDYAIFGSQGNIEFTSPKFKFITSFIEVDPSKTTLTISPPESLNSPIAYLKITPKKTPLFIQGEIDFRSLSFNNFIISHSDFILQFKK